MNCVSIKFLFIWGLAGIVWLLLAGTVATGQTPPPGGDDVFLSGFLTRSAPDGLPRQYPSALHYIHLTQGRSYAIRMESSELTTSLRLEDMEGNLLAADAEFVDLNADIIFSPPSTGSYRLVASSMPPTIEGYYAITVRELPTVLRVETALAIDDACENECFHKVHELALIAGRRYFIDLTSNEFDPFAKLLNPDGAIVAFNDECDGRGTARIVFEAPRTGTYRLVATSSAPHAIGAFRLSVCCEE